MASQVNLFKKIAFTSQQFFNFRDPQEEEFVDDTISEEIREDITNDSNGESDINTPAQQSQFCGCTAMDVLQGGQYVYSRR